MIKIIITLTLFFILFFYNSQYITENFNSLLPDPLMLRGFNGDKSLKVTWIEPQSKLEISNYYLIIYTKNDNKFLQIHSIKNTQINNEYLFTDLDNNNVYEIFGVSKNLNGLSAISNKISLIPQSNNIRFDRKNIKKKNEYSDDIPSDEESYKRINKLENKEKKVIYNNLKNIILNESEINIEDSDFNIIIS